MPNDDDAHRRALHESREPAVFGPTEAEVEAARARREAKRSRQIDPALVALDEGPAGAAMRGGPTEFWTGIAGEEFGVQFGLLVEMLAAPGFVEGLREQIAKIDCAETTGPILDPTFWSRSPNAFGRARLCRHLLGAGVALGEAERRRRSEWDGGERSW